MLSYVNIWPVIRDHFSPYRYGERRRFSVKHLTAFLLFPLAVGVAISFWKPAGADDAQETFLTVNSIIAAVFLTLLPVVQSVVGLAEVDRRYTEGERPLFRQQVLRLQVLRELYAEIGYAVILLVVSLVPLMLVKASWATGRIDQVMSAFVYYVSIAVGISFLHIIAGIYLILDVQAHEANKKLINNAPPEYVHQDKEDEAAA